MRILFRSSLLRSMLMALGACGCLTNGWTQALNNMTGPDAAKPNSLLITIIDGEGALNDVRTRTAREPIVEVDDENHKPVAGALVLFSINNGSSTTPFASFSGAQTLSVHTDAAGHAIGRGFQITGRKGKYQIAVQASLGALQAAVIIHQENSTVSTSSSGAASPVKVLSLKKLEWILGGAAAGAVIAGMVIATQGSSRTAITPGTGTVGAPGVVPGFQLQFHPRRP